MTQLPVVETQLDRATRYRMREMLGRGCGTEVWEAEGIDGRRVALKLLPWDNPRTAEAKIGAIEALHLLKHPNLLPITEVWFQPSHLVVAMERADRSLAEELEAQGGDSFSAEEAGTLLAPAATALDFLNSRQHQLAGHCVGFQHGGVKLSNLLIFGPTVKLADFGLTGDVHLPVPGPRRLGRLAFAAPEVLQGLISDWTDQYSLALVYCQLRGVEMPCSDPEADRAPIDLTPLSPEERPIIARALQAAPRERWSACQELMSQLQKCAGSRGPMKTFVRWENGPPGSRSDRGK